MKTNLSMENCKQIFGKIIVKNKTLFVGKQDFDNNTVEIFDNKTTVKAPIFIDKDGDLYFKYLDKKYWFREI